MEAASIYELARPNVFGARMVVDLSIVFVCHPV